MRNVTIIGTGRVGGAFALGLSRGGYTIDKLVVRSDKIAASVASEIVPRPMITTLEDAGLIQSEVVILATKDGEIAGVVEQLNDRLKPGIAVLHVSGALSSDVLQTLRAAGARVGSIHPLVSISDPFLGAENLTGAFFCAEGDQDAVATGREIAGALGGQCFSIETRFKSLYHAAAVTACGHFVALLDASVEMLKNCGIAPPEAQEMLMPLVRSTVENLNGQSLKDALTGPFARGDSVTFEKHMTAFEELGIAEETRSIYLLLAERSLKLAAAHGTDASSLNEITKKVLLAKKKSRC